MSEFKGTKGEWRSDQNEYFCDVRSYGGKNTMVASVFLYDEKMQDMSISEEGKANAKLIAASPDLLEALQLMKKIIDDTPESGLNPIIDTYGDFREKVNKAIKKALGDE